MSTPQTRLSTPASAAAGNIDVLPAGASISGIGVGYRLKTGLADKAFPGVRSDSDLPKFVYQIKPWTRDHHLFWINGQAVGFGQDGDGDGWVPACEHFALARSDLRRHQIGAAGSRPGAPARRAPPVTETTRQAPLGKTQLRATVWAVPGREPGQTRNLRHWPGAGPAMPSTCATAASPTGVPRRGHGPRVRPLPRTQAGPGRRRRLRIRAADIGSRPLD